MTDEQAIDVAGWRGCWRETGAGPAVVILATPFVLARSYERTARALGKRFRVIALQMPGSGRAAKLPTPWTVADYGKWVAAALDALDLRPAAVIGHSHSGAIAMQAAADRPDRVGRLVLADTVGGAGPGAWRRVLYGRVIDALLEARLTLGAWHHLLYNVFAHFRNFRAQMAHAIGADVREAAAAAVMVGDRPDTDGRFAVTLGCRYAQVWSGVTPAGAVVDPVPDLVAPDLAGIIDQLMV